MLGSTVRADLPKRTAKMVRQSSSWRYDRRHRARRSGVQSGGQNAGAEPRDSASPEGAPPGGTQSHHSRTPSAAISPDSPDTPPPVLEFTGKPPIGYRIRLGTWRPPISYYVKLFDDADFHHANYELYGQIPDRPKDQPASPWPPTDLVEAFVQRWKALPWSYLAHLEYQPALAVLSGKWGVIPVFPWTTDRDLTAAARKIRRAIGKIHRDANTARRGILAQWLELHRFSDAEIAHAVWGPRTSEPRAIAAVRIAIRRSRRFVDALHQPLDAPRECDPLAWEISQLLRDDFFKGDPTPSGLAAMFWKAIGPDWWLFQSREAGGGPT